MPAKSKKSEDKKSVDNKSDKTNTTYYSSFGAFTDSDETYCPARCVGLNLRLIGEPPGNTDFIFLAIFNGITILDGPWRDDTEIGTDSVPINLNDSNYQALITSKPIILLLRSVAAKGAKQEPDPLLHTENRAGATVDLLPLLIGEEEIFTTVDLISITTGQLIGCQVVVRATCPGITEHQRIPLLITMTSAHCMPIAREGTVYVSAIGLSDLHEPKAVNFGQSSSTPDALKLVWASSSTIGQAANTAFNVPKEDMYVPDDFNLKDSKLCLSFYWNALNRVLVDAEELTKRLSTPFLIEVAGIPKSGKAEVRGRYMGWVDAGALLEPGQLDVTVCSKLVFYNEANAMKDAGLLTLPPTTAKTASARETDMILDEYGHNAYVVIRFDVIDALVPKAKITTLYDAIGFPPPEGHTSPIDQLETNVKPELPFVDARYVRESGGALAVHKELSQLACRGVVPMNQGINRSAAHLLLIRVRTMLKNFPPGDCSYIDWQDTVTGQHAASRRAVSASFAPQPPPPRLPDRVAAARCRVAGDERLAQNHIKTNLKVAGRHPRSLASKTLRCLEERNDLDAKNYLIEALNSHVRNRYLLWILGAQEYDKGPEAAEVASAAFRIAVKGDYSDGTANAIAWAALHTFHHTNGNMYGAYVAARRMRKSFTLPREWKKVLNRWTDTSGEEEILWNPATVSSDNAILIAAAFFLCLRCYKFSESLLQCVENHCFTRGSHRLKYVQGPDVHYLRAASLILRHQFDLAMEIIQEGIQRFGPSALMSHIRVNCLSNMRAWDAECEKAFQEAERAGVKASPSILYKSALARFKTDPIVSLQRAARAHKMAASGQTELLIGRIYACLGKNNFAQRWCAAAVKIEPLLADGWAILSILAMYERKLDKARAMLRTARQVGPISPDIEEDLKKMMDIVELEQLPESLVRNMFCK